MQNLLGVLLLEPAGGPVLPLTYPIVSFCLSVSLKQTNTLTDMILLFLNSVCLCYLQANLVQIPFIDKFTLSLGYYYHTFKLVTVQIIGFGLLISPNLFYHHGQHFIITVVLLLHCQAHHCFTTSVKIKCKYVTCYCLAFVMKKQNTSVSRCKCIHINEQGGVLENQ